jgi:hypothetical protein
VTIDPTKFTILKSVKIQLVGDAASTTSKISEFLTTNQTLLTTAGLKLETQVSSWAVVVDVTWKKAFADVRK